MTVGITGASGFVGGAFARAYARDGAEVVAYARDPARVPAVPRITARAYELGNVPDLDGVDLLVHCAFAARNAGADDGIDRNVAGTTLLFDAARRLGIDFVFISSISASLTIESAYSQQKRAIEERVGSGALVLRPGLVAGEGGLFATLRRIASRRVVPVIDGGRGAVQLIAVDDLYDALRRAAAAGLRGPHNVVTEPPLPLREVLGALAPRPPVFVDVPLRVAFPIAALAERVGLTLPITTENLRGLRGATLHAASAELYALGWSPLPAATVLARAASKVPA